MIDYAEMRSLATQVANDEVPGLFVHLMPDDVLALLDELERLRFALRQYGGHFVACEYPNCTCGFLAAWRAK